MYNGLKACSHTEKKLKKLNKILQINEKTEQLKGKMSRRLNRHCRKKWPQGPYMLAHPLTHPAFSLTGFVFVLPILTSAFP